MDPCHDMARPQLADGGKASNMGGEVPANILKKQSRTAGKGWYSSLGFGRAVKKSSL